MNLNDKQLQAKEHITGPLLIIAGAGSGKTATLIARVEYMIAKKGIIPDSIMMLTFTNKAASEMRERLAKTMGVQAPRNLFLTRNFPLIGTFHSLGIYLLKQVLDSTYADKVSEQIGTRKNFIIYDESDKVSVVKSILKNELMIDEKEFPAKQISFHISNAKNNLVTPKLFESQIDSPIKEVVGKVYYKYEENLKANNALDFDDILVKTLHLLKIPEILEHYSNRFEYFMVDEYQDTNKPQYEIVRLLSKKHRNLVVVGDDSQSIYSWRGADMQNIIDFKKDYEKAVVIKLEQNYRSTKNIIAGANSVIKNNNSGIKKELWTEGKEGNKIQYIVAPDDRTEARIIVEIIEKENAPYSKNLILYRTNAQSRQLEEALLMKNIPYKVVGGMKFYDRKEIKDILAYLKVIFNSDDVVNLKRIINTPSRKIGAKSLEVLENYSQMFGFSYFSVLENIEDVDEMKAGAKGSIIKFYEIIKKLKKSAQEIEVSELIKEIVTLTDYKEYITNGLSEEEKQSKLDNIDELINVASEYNGMEPGISLSTFLEEIALITDMDTKDERSDYVTLMTIHTSKGLEQERVFLCGAEEGIFPSFRSVGNAFALEEERRLMYVAMTRAKQELYISRAIERFYFGDFVRNPESRFIQEIDENTLEEFETKYASNSNLFSSVNSVFNPSVSSETRIVTPSKRVANNDISDFYKGAKVQHHKFGDGIIIKLNGELADISFPGKGTKKMNVKIAPLTVRK